MDDTRRRQHLQGITAIALAPFTEDGSLDVSGVDGNVGHLADGGITSIVVGGNVGEYYSLSIDERDTLLSRTVDRIDGRDILVIAGVGGDVLGAVAAARRSADLGAEAVMVHEPPHPHATAEGLCDYYEQIAEGSPLPVIPYISRQWLTAEAVIALASRIDPIAVKFAVNDLPMLSRVVAACPDVVWVCGNAELWAPAFYTSGARGFTSGIVNIDTVRPLSLHAALEAGDFTRARATWSELEPFERLRARDNSGYNVSVVKSALDQLGRSAGSVRPPATLVNSETRVEIREIIASWGLLQGA